MLQLQEMSDTRTVAMEASSDSVKTKCPDSGPGDVSYQRMRG